MKLGQRYLGSRGVPESLVEDGGLGNLASPGHLEESASHHESIDELEPEIRRPNVGVLELSKYRCLHIFLH